MHFYPKFSERILKNKKFDYIFFDISSSYCMSFIKLLYSPRTIIALNKQPKIEKETFHIFQAGLCNDLS